MRIALTALVVALGLSTAAAAATTTVTINADPQLYNMSAAATEPLVLTGTVSSGRAGESVRVFARTCGLPPSLIGEAETRAGGAWRLETGVVARSAFHAEWRSEKSPPITVNVRPRVQIEHLARTNRFRVGVGGYQYFTRAILQKFVRGKGWVRAGTATLKRQGGFSIVWSGGYGRAAVKRGDQVRAVVPAPRGSCHATGISLITTVV